MINWLGNPALPRLLKVTPPVYPHLNDFYRESKFSLLKPSYKHSRGSSEFLNQNLKQIGLGVPELWSEKQTDRRTNRENNYIYIFEQFTILKI